MNHQIPTALLCIALASAAFAQPVPATSPAIVKHEAARTWIDGVGELTWDKSPSHTFPGALAALTKPTDHPLDYDLLLAACGVSWRTRWFHGFRDPLFHGVSPVVELPEDVKAIEKTCGYSLVVRTGTGKQQSTNIIASIDRGLGVVSYVNAKEWDCGYIFGYDNGGEHWLTMDYYRGKVTVPQTDPHTWFLYLTWRGNPLPPGQILLQGTDIATIAWDRADVPAEELLPWCKPDTAKLCYGRRAYQQWSADLEEWADLPPAEKIKLQQVSTWVATNIVDARSSAARLLRKQCKSIGPAAEPHLLKAAGLCEQIANRLRAAMDKKEAFPHGPTPELTDDLRNRQVALLKEISALDEQVIQQLDEVQLNEN